MGLSNNEKVEQLTTAQVVLKLVDALQNLNKDSIAQLAQDAYALPEMEQKKADNARADIATYQNLVAQQKQLALDLQAEQDDIDKRAGELKDASKTLSAKSNALDQRAKSLDEQEKGITQRTVALDAREAALNKALTVLTDGQNKLAQDQEQLANDRGELDAKAEKAKALFG